MWVGNVLPHLQLRRRTFIKVWKKFLKQQLSKCGIRSANKVCLLMLSSAVQNSSEEEKNMVDAGEATLESLSFVVKELNNASFKLPKLPEKHLTVSFLRDITETEIPRLPNKALARLGASNVVEAKIVAAKELTVSDPCVKTTLQLTVEFNEEHIPYEPGDSFGFFCSNSPEEVVSLLQHLELEGVADDPCEIISSGKKRPVHIPPFATLRYILTSCVDIRCVPKKVFLRVLASFTQSQEERHVLEYLSSVEGSSFYTECIRKYSLCILDLIKEFKSCQPPFETLLEHLPPLKPRFYSVTSSPLLCERSFGIIFNVISIQNHKEPYSERKGVCTGWFERMAKGMLSETVSATSIEDNFSSLSLLDHYKPTVFVYKRQNKKFLLPNDQSVPLVMVGPGTGVAPFLSFLQHREIQMKESVPNCKFGESWLFYGCRYQEKDFLCREELETFHSSGVLSHLVVCFSRDEPQSLQPRRVQDNIIKYSKSIVDVIDAGAVIYVCGNAKHMVQDVHEAFTKVITNTKNCSESEAQQRLKELEEADRYLVDFWI